MAISSSTFISESTLLLRNILKNGITDPIAARRPANEDFVMTSYPKESVRYPIITVKSIGPGTSRRLGAGSQFEWTKMPFEIRIWALDMKTKDNLTEQVYNFLRSNQNTGQNTSSEGLHDFEISSNVPVEEEGVNGVKSQVMNVNYMFVLGA